MEKAFRSLTSPLKVPRESALKHSITSHLSDSIKQFQLGAVEQAAAFAYELTSGNSSLNANEDDCQDAQNALSAAVEAMFLHGLKDTLTYRVRKALADIDQRPAPSFWSPVLVVSHCQSIDQIDRLRHIVTEVGQCRAWIRMALNDGLLSSYLATMLQDSSILKPYYHWYAYLRDAEQLEVARGLIVGIENGVAERGLSLPCNSSLLNTWPVPSLVLAGVWAPTLKSIPVSAAVDVAQSLRGSEPAVNPDRDSISSQYSAISQPLTTFSEDEALKIILARNDQDKQQTSLRSIEQSSQHSRSVSPKPMTKSDSAAGQTFKAKSDSAQTTNARCESEESTTVETEQPEILIHEPISLEHSYNELINNMVSGMNDIGTPNLAQVVRDLNDLRKSNGDTDDAITCAPLESLASPVDVLSYDQQYPQLAREHGLSRQQYCCASPGCTYTLVKTKGAHLCAFSGRYYCDNCAVTDGRRMLIPARIVFNWDFREYAVSKSAMQYLEERREVANIDVKSVNPQLCTVVSELGDVQRLRTQLTYLYAYLTTCQVISSAESNTVKDVLLPQNQEHLVQHVNLYSIKDFVDLRNGTLIPMLEKAVNASRMHVHMCKQCQHHGFYCELCKGTDLLFPFELDVVYRCEICSNVFHKHCLDASKPCPRCLRRKQIQTEHIQSVCENDS